MRGRRKRSAPSDDPLNTNVMMSHYNMFPWMMGRRSGFSEGSGLSVSTRWRSAPAHHVAAQTVEEFERFTGFLTTKVTYFTSNNLLES